MLLLQAKPARQRVLRSFLGPRLKRLRTGDIEESGAEGACWETGRGQPCPLAAGVGGCQTWLPGGTHTMQPLPRPENLARGQPVQLQGPLLPEEDIGQRKLFSIFFFHLFFFLSFPKLLKFWKNSAFRASKAHFTGRGASSGDGGSLAGSRVAWGGLLCSLLQACLHPETEMTEGPAFASLMERALGNLAAAHTAGWRSCGCLEPLRRCWHEGPPGFCLSLPTYTSIPAHHSPAPFGSGIAFLPYWRQGCV